MVNELLHVAAALDRAAADNPNAELVFIGDDELDEHPWSYVRVQRRALEVASMLAEKPLRAGDRVALVLPRPEMFVPTFFGVLYAGGSAVPLAPPGPGRLETYLNYCRHVLSAAGASLLITTPFLADQLRPLINSTGTGRFDVLALDELGGDTRAFRPPPLDPESVALIQFTSGSTARPKGVALTHRNLVANSIAIMGEGLRATGRDRGVSWLPLYHDMGLIGFVIAATVGMTPVTYIPTELFLRRPAVWLRVLSRHRGSITFAPNFAYALAARSLRDADIAGIDLSSVRVAGCGAEPIQAETLRAFARRFAPFGFDSDAFVPSYGMAESSLGISFGSGIPSEYIHLQTLVADRRAEIVPGEGNGADTAVEMVGCGRPFSGHALEIVDPASRQPLPVRHVGEILVKGPSVAGEYVDDSGRTTPAVDVEGWLHTGDLGYLDEDRQVFICGRLKDLIIVNGRNFYPHDIEWAAASVDGVRIGNVAAFAVSSRDCSTEMAVVMAESKLARQPESRTRIAAEIRAAVLRAVGLAVHEVLVVAPRSIPKTSSGKVQRGRARSLYEAGSIIGSTVAHTLPAPHASRASASASSSA
jgi:fatty-acyl-CoA synthase